MRTIQFILLISISLSFVNTSIAQKIEVKDSIAYFYNDDLDSLKHYLKQGYFINYQVWVGSSLKVLPKRIAKMPKDKLVFFGCYDCKLESLPKQFIRFKNLKEVIMDCHVDLFYDDLSGLVNRVTALKSLEKLSLNNYDFDKMGSINSKSLKYLSISHHNNLYIFPNTVLDLKQLEELTISGCQFDTIPNKIGNIESLQELNITGPIFVDNVKILSKIPKTIGQLRNLEVFTLENANIKTLPKTLFDLPKLKQIYLKQTGIEYFHEDIAYNGNLTYFKLFADQNFQGFPSAIKDFELERFSVFITSPSLSFIKNRPFLFGLRENVAVYTEVIKSHDFAYGSSFEYENPEFIDTWEVFESSNDTLELQLIPELDALTGKYFLCRGNQSYISNFYNDDVDNFSADLGFNIYKEGNLFFGEVNSSIAVLFEQKYKDYPLYFHAEIDKETDIMTLTNRVGVVYKLKRMEK